MYVYILFFSTERNLRTSINKSGRKMRAKRFRYVRIYALPDAPDLRISKISLFFSREEITREE